MKITFLGILMCFVAIDGLRMFHRGRRLGGNLGEPVVNFDPLRLPSDEWFNQTLDHFDHQNTRTWQQRFFRNGDFYKPGGPVFLMIGGEGEASAKWMVAGAWINYAETHRALCFQLEHRFYGQSHPTDDLSVENLKYLSSQQALADLASFIKTMSVSLPPKTKWIVFGGSYPGSLAAWARARYPHLIHAAVSASGPLLALPDFQDYYKVVEDALNATSPGCVEAVAASGKQLSLMLSQKVGQQSAAKLFQLCNPIDPLKPEETQNLYETLASNFAGIVQYNKDNRISASGPSNITIDVACDVMEDATRGVAVWRLAALSNMLLSASNQTCLDASYANTVLQLKNTSWGSETAEGGRQWTYQTCTEFGFFQTSTLPETQRLFGDFPLELFTKQCTDIFGADFTPDLLQVGVNVTNVEYGAYDYKATRTVFVHGTIDPWHALGITQSLGPYTPAIYIQGTAHCANMYPASQNDLPQLTNARKTITQLIGKWLKVE